MPKSHAQSDTILRRFTGSTAPSIPTTYVNLLTTLPTSSNPTGWVEWRESENAIIVRKQVYTDGATSPYWNDPEVQGDAKIVDNNGGISWSTTDLGTLLDGAQVLKGVGVFTTATTSYTNGEPGSLADLIYWAPLSSDMNITSGESVVFLDGSIQITEQ